MHTRAGFSHQGGVLSLMLHQGGIHQGGVLSLMLHQGGIHQGGISTPRRVFILRRSSHQGGIFFSPRRDFSHHGGISPRRHFSHQGGSHQGGTFTHTKAVFPTSRLHSSNVTLMEAVSQYGILHQGGTSTIEVVSHRGSVSKQHFQHQSDISS